MEKTAFRLNGKNVSIVAEAERPLLWTLRADFKLTGTKYGCGQGYCGACTVLVSGKAERSCSLSLGDVAGKNIITIEGLSAGATLHPVQQAFIEHDALQCGFCTPGMVLNAVSLLNENPDPSEQDIIDNMQGNLCRCGAYRRIITAVQAAAEIMGAHHG